MARWVVSWLVIVAFAAALGHLIWHAWLGPPPAPEHMVGGEVIALAGPDADAKQLYLRRKFYLTQYPQHAWIQVVGRDRIRLYVNSRFVSEQILDGFPVAIVADVTPFLKPGRNVIGIVARQSSTDCPPLVAVEGGYELLDGEHALTVDVGWRCNTFFERGSDWWFEPEFDDGHWAIPQQVRTTMRGKIKRPQRVATARCVGDWISSPDGSASSTSFRRTFDVPVRPDQAWLRVTTTSAYRLAINGLLLDEQEEQLGTMLPTPPIQRSYDVTPVMRAGRNTVCVAVTSAVGPPHLLADLEVEDSEGHRVTLGTDDRWLSRNCLANDWMAKRARSADWEPCQVASGDLGIAPWMPQRQDVQLDTPWSVFLTNAAGELGVMVIIAFFTFLACRFWTHCLHALHRDIDPTATEGLVVLALVPATIGIVGGVLASHDPRVALQEVYRTLWVSIAIGSVLLQWALLAVLACGRAVNRQWRCGNWLRSPLSPTTLLVLLLMAVGMWLRMQDIESVRQWDEVENYNATRNMLATGFPSLRVHDDLPPLLIHTSEAQFPPMALASLFFEDDRYIVRFPMVCFSTLGIGLIYLVGRRMFDSLVGVVAAILYTFSPVCIGMASFGRYFSQVQFFTLLTFYFFWLTLRGCGPINCRALWLTAVSFIITFFSWEGAAFIALAMVPAGLFQRRGRLHTMLVNRSVWLAVLLVGSAVLLQYCHALLVKTQFLWYGTSLSDLSLKPMWRYPGLQPWYYVLEASWTQDALLPIVGLFGAIALAVRHPWRTRLRFLLTIYLGTCLFMSMTLPGLAWRYIHHLVPLSILLASVTIAAVVHHLARLSRNRALPLGWGLYPRAVGVAGVIAVVALASGMTIELAEIRQVRVEGYGVTVYKFPNFEGPARYVSEHMAEGDIVLATDPFHINHLVRLTGRPEYRTNFWMSTALRFPATIDDCRTLPLDRRDGTRMVASLESLQDIFARHPRVWVLVQPERHEVLNDRDVGVFLRQHTDVVFEDWQSLVLFRGDKHRTALERRKSEDTLHRAQGVYLP
ncbi:MAG: glycosyltransferase family 39 protein [Gemmataceae bacterium]|nr:glycosyltransferase family 39 protein [Gemmataceae bacterium]